MNLNNFIIYTYFLGCFLVISCINPPKERNVIYFTGTDVSNTIRLSVEGPTDRGMTVRSSLKVNDDVSIDLKVDKTLIDEYNSKNNTNYKPAPDNSYNLSVDRAYIKAGGYISDPIILNINSVADFKDEDTYCIPVTITGANDGYPVLGASSTIYVIVNKVIVTQAVQLSGNYFKVAAFDKDDALKSVSEVSMEARVYLRNTELDNPYISTIMGWEELYMLRVGDINIPRGAIQLSASVQYATSKTPITLNQWVHLAAVYDGAQIKLYVDGELSAYADAVKGPVNFAGVDPTRNFCIGATEIYGRYFDGDISEVRIWNRVLTVAEIKGGMCAVPLNSKGLLAYWRFDNYKSNNEKRVIPDVTGHGYDAVGIQEIQFTPGVKCP